MSHPHKNVQNIQSELTTITANHSFQTGLQVLQLVEDVQQEVQASGLDIACMALNNQLPSLRCDIRNRSVIHIRLSLNHLGLLQVGSALTPC